MYEQLTQSVRKVLREHFDHEVQDVPWKRPEEGLGDVSTPIALQLSKELGKKPSEIAEALQEALGDLEEIEKVEVAGPGYVNLWLTPSTLLRHLSVTRTACTAKVKNSEPPVVVEYSGPNIAKPLGIHHILSTVIGQVIANLYDHQGYNVETVNHIGDWGTQFGKLAVAFERWGDKPLEQCSVDDLLTLYVKFHEEVEKDDSLEQQARDAFAKLEQGDSELREFRETVVAISMKAIKVLYKRLHVTIEHGHGESMYQEKMQPIVDEGKEKGVFKAGKEGALIAEFDESTHMPPAIVLKADGSTIYHTRDLATIRYRIDTWHPQSILYVVDIAQQLYFRQLFDMVSQLGWELPHLEHVYFGRMSFLDGKMSTRKGTMLRLEEVLDEAESRAAQAIKEHGDEIQSEDPEELAEIMGIGSVSYSILSQSRKKDLVFDWNKALNFEGNSAPYLQYTHARAKSVLRKGEVEDVELPDNIESFSEKERVLIGTLLRFEQVLEEAREAHMPHILANFLFQLCQDYNTFYNDNPILKAPEPQRTLRLALTALTASVLKTGAEILTIRVPDRM